MIKTSLQQTNWKQEVMKVVRTLIGNSILKQVVRTLIGSVEKKQQLQIMDLDTVMFSERRVNPEIWDFHWVGGCHKESTRKQNKKEYDKLVEEASTKKG